jgi:hypothetical protein
LGNKSDDLEIYRPDPPQLPPHPDAGYVPSILVEKVNYDLSDGWPPGAAGTGLALHRLDLKAYGNDPANWFAGVATPGAPAPVGIAPTIQLQPASLVVKPGDDAMFSVAAAGSSPMSYQWRRDGLALSGRTATPLLLSAVATNDAGTYDVVITNAAGVVTSAMARLSVTVPPQVVGVRWESTGVTVSLDAGNGPVIELLASTNLSDWSVVARLTNYAGARVLNDPTAGPAPARFYRSRIVPLP